MKKVDGHTIKNQIKENLKEQLTHTNETIRLDLFYVGNDATIETFMQLKKQFGEDIGIQVVGHTFEKDVDVLSSEMKKRFAEHKSPILPPVVGAIKEICDQYNITLTNKSIAIVGRGKLVGRPTALWLDNQEIQHDVYEKGDDLTQLKTADIIISGAGDPHIITSDLVASGAILFDAGTTQSDGGVRGDIHPDSYQKAQLVTPVPGGIGPVTIAKLFQNLLTLQNW